MYHDVDTLLSDHVLRSTSMITCSRDKLRDSFLRKEVERAQILVIQS